MASSNLPVTTALTLLLLGGVVVRKTAPTTTFVTVARSDAGDAGAVPVTV